MIIDAHTHIYNEKMYQDYTARLGSKDFKAIVMAWESVGNEQVLRFTETKGNLYFIGTVIMDKNIASQLKILEKWFKAGKMRGIKLYPGYKYFYPSDKIVYPIARLCQKYNKPLIFHFGDVFDEKGNAILKYSNPSHVDELAVKFPKCRIIISHFGFPYFLETANVVSKNKNVYTDISGTIDECGNAWDMNNLVRQYAADLKRAFAYFPEAKKKTMFGTDFFGVDTPLNQVRPYLKIAKSVFTKKEQESLFFKLANKLFFS
ncbi:MAG: amidohydrolase family protein [Patescibacteria group bacterium]